MNDDPRKDPNEAKEEFLIFNQFLLIVRDKFITPTPSSPTHSTTSRIEREERMRRIDELYNSPIYKSEKDMLTKMNNEGMLKGIAAGIGTFCVLRAGPRILLRHLQKRHGGTMNGANNSHNSHNGRNGGYRFDTNARSTTGSTPSQPIRKPGIVFRTFKLSIDLFASLTTAAIGSMYFTDRDKLLETATEIPLVEGRSLLSDELCDDFVDVYRGIPKRTWDKYVVDSDGSGGDGGGGNVGEGSSSSESLTALSTFVKNCLKRRAVEEKVLEQERQFGSNTVVVEDDREGRCRRHVPIPPPGVPDDIPIVIEWGDRSEDVKVGRGYDDEEVDEDEMFGFDSFSNGDDDAWDQDRFVDEMNDSNDNHEDSENGEQSTRSRRNNRRWG